MCANRLRNSLRNSLTIAFIVSKHVNIVMNSFLQFCKQMWEEMANRNCDKAVISPKRHARTSGRPSAHTHAPILRRVPFAAFEWVSLSISKHGLRCYGINRARTSDETAAYVLVSKLSTNQHATRHSGSEFRKIWHSTVNNRNIVFI